MLLLERSVASATGTFVILPGVVTPTLVQSVEVIIQQFLPVLMLSGKRGRT